MSSSKFSAHHLRKFDAPTPEERFAAWLTTPSPDDAFSTRDFAATTLLPHVRLLTFTPATAQILPTATFTYTVQPAHCNPQTLHGGAIATLFDVLTSFALIPIQQKGWWYRLGVSRTLSVTYLKPAYAGEVLEVFVEVVAIGARMANLRGTMKRADGRVVAIAVHDKANVDKEVKKPKL